MKRIHPIHATLLAMVVVVGISSGQGVSEGTTRLGDGNVPAPGSVSENYWEGVPALTEVFTRATVSKGLSAMSGEYEKEAAFLREVRELFSKEAKSRGLTSGQRRKGLQSIDQDIAANKGYSKWTKRLGQALDVIDFVSVGAKALAYLSEGDKEGAVDVVVKEVAKKATVTLTSLGLSVVPVVGSTVGAELGEQFHENFTVPAIDRDTDRLRVERLKEEMYGMRAPRVRVIKFNGQVAELPRGYYLKKDGKIGKRNREEQGQYEAGYRKRVLEGRAKQRKFDEEHPEVKEAREAYEKGDLDLSEYTRTVNAALRKTKPEPEEGERENGEEMVARKETGELDLPQPEGELTAPIFKQVNPIRVTASMKIDHDMSSGGIRNIVTSTITVTFWNVGTQAPGYGAAVMKRHAKSSMGPEESSVLSGTFSGGPNGVLRFSDEGESIVLKLVNGTSITAPGGNMTVKNPGAFAGWPK